MERVIYWIQSVGLKGKERVPMYFKGRWARDCEDGSAGDVKVRPVRLGEGPFTMTVSPDCCENEDGSPV